MLKIIAMFAQMAVGKDTAADYLAQKIDEHRSWRRDAFANAVKNTYCHGFGVSRKFIEDWKRNSEPPPGMLMNVRNSLQFIGDGFRKIKPDIWIEAALKDDVKKIISDGRYLNEASYIYEKGGLNILLSRPGYLNDDPSLSEAEMRPLVEYCENNFDDGEILKNKNSPKELKYFDFFLKNNGTIEDFYLKIDNILIPFINKKYNI